MNDRRSGFIVLLLGDPHLLEGGERSKDGSSDPDRVLPLRWSNDLDLHGARSKSSDLLLHPVSDARIHGGASGEHVVGVEIFSDVDVALHDRVVIRSMDAS